MHATAVKSSVLCIYIYIYIYNKQNINYIKIPQNNYIRIFMINFKT